MLLDEGEHGGEGGEQQDAPAFLDERGQQLVGEVVQLGGLGDFLRGHGLEQLRMAADLAELEQRVEHDDVRLAEALGGDGVADALVHGGADGFVEVGLFLGELDAVDDLGFFRQLGGDLVLGAAQDERRDAAVQRKLGVAGAVALDGAADGAC